MLTPVVHLVVVLLPTGLGLAPSSVILRVLLSTRRKICTSETESHQPLHASVLLRRQATFQQFLVLLLSILFLMPLL